MSASSGDTGHCLHVSQGPFRLWWKGLCPWDPPGEDAASWYIYWYWNMLQYNSNSSNFLPEPHRTPTTRQLEAMHNLGPALHLWTFWHISQKKQRFTVWHILIYPQITWLAGMHSCLVWFGSQPWKDWIYKQDGVIWVDECRRIRV